MPSQFPSSSYLRRQTFPFSSSFSPVFIAKQLMLHEVSLWPVWVTCPGWILFQLLAHIQPTHFGGGEKEKVVILCKQSSAIAKQWFFINIVLTINANQNIIWTTVKNINFIPVIPSASMMEKNCSDINCILNMLVFVLVPVYNITDLMHP